MVQCRVPSVDIFLLTLLLVYTILELVCDGAVDVIIIIIIIVICVACMATLKGLEGPGIESRWCEIFRALWTGNGAHLATCTMGTGSPSRG